MKECPRCHQRTLHDEEVMNSLSKRDYKTYICSGCGEVESLIDCGVKPASKMERDFVASLQK